MYKKEIIKKSHGLKLTDTEEDFNDLKKIVKVKHVHPILKNYNEHEFKMRLDHYIFGCFLCPKCNPELTTEYGKEIMYNMYKEEIYKKDEIVNGVEVDFILKDKKTCLKYFGLEYFSNHSNYNKLANEIIEAFENSEEYDLIIMDYLDLENEN